MALQAEQAVGEGVIALILQKLDGEEFAPGFGHFTAVGVKMQNVHPVAAPLVAEVGLGLCDLVGVMGEGVINAAAVYVEILAQMLHGDAGAFDVPAGIADAPGGVPFQRLILELRLGEPEYKVILVALVGVLLNALSDADVKIIGIEVVENVVFFKLRGVEIDIAARKIGISGVHELGNDFDVFVDAVCGWLDDVGGLDVELCAVGEECVGVEFGDIHHGLVFALRALEHLILALVGVAC